METRDVDPNRDVGSILHDEAAIQSRLDVLAREITEDYRGRSPFTVLTILHGGMIFMADLLRRVPLPLQMESLQVSSYHGEKESSGQVTFHQNLPDLRDQHILIVDDILDTGRTLHAIRSRFEEELQPASVRICVLLQKRKPRAVEVTAEYVGFEIDDEFVIGYGLDFQGRYRNLPYIGVLHADHTP